MNKKTTKTAILKGYGDFYGHNFKVEITEKDNLYNVKSNGIEIDYDKNTGFAFEREMQRNGYQLDINSISKGVFSENISIYGINKLGQFSV